MPERSAGLELVVACATVGAVDAPALAALAAQQPDWDELLAQAERHGLRPLVHHRLEGAAGMPLSVAANLAAHHRANAHHNLLLCAILFELLALLEHAGIVAIPFKGPLLAEQAYGDLGLREFSDLDLMVRPGDALTAMRLLEGAGYRLSKGLPDRLDGYHRRFVEVQRGLTVELHWGIALDYLPLALDFDDLWARRHPTALAGRPVAAFSIEDTLLLLCVHGARHLWLGLNWVRDIAGLLERYPEIAWGTLFERARQAGCLRMVWLGVYLARTLLKAPLSAATEQMLSADARVVALAATVERRLAISAAFPLPVPETYGFYLGVRERWQDRARLLAEIARLLITPIPEDREAFPLPRYLGFLYPLLRPARLVAQRLRRRPA